jgi:hypothetical protein
MGSVAAASINLIVLWRSGSKDGVDKNHDMPACSVLVRHSSNRKQCCQC